MTNDTNETWKWSYSRWIGITYGPIPIGLLVAIPILIALGSGS